MLLPKQVNSYFIAYLSSVFAHVCVYVCGSRLIPEKISNLLSFLRGKIPVVLSESQNSKFHFYKHT